MQGSYTGLLIEQIKNSQEQDKTNEVQQVQQMSFVEMLTRPCGFEVCLYKSRVVLHTKKVNNIYFTMQGIINEHCNPSEIYEGNDSAREEYGVKGFSKNKNGN